MKLVLLALVFFNSGTLILPSAVARPIGTRKPATISDHRVQNLSCRNVTANSVANAIRPDNFSTANHLPYKNWEFQWGFYKLAGCWSLSRFQRLYFYLREPAAGLSLTELSNQTRSEEMYEDGASWKGFPLKKFWFMPEQTNSRWPAWESGWFESGSMAPDLERGLKPDIEYYQALRFHQLENIRLLKGPMARTIAENNATWNDLSRLVSTGRKPLIVLRPDKYYQHVVVVKRIQATASGADLWVYDSNAPWLDRKVVWDKKSSMFTAFEVVDGMPVPDARAALGVFIVDEDENERVLESLAVHYQNLCSAP